MKKITEKKELKIAQLYRKLFGAQQIADMLHLSINQVYGSLQRQKIARRTPSKQNKIRFLNSPLSFNFLKKINKENKVLSAAALMLYRGEGAKTGNTVDLANSDTSTLLVFIAFLRKVCQIDENRLKLYLYCFSNQDSKRLISYWSKILKVPKKNFTKPYIRQTVVNPARRMPYGVLHIRYSDKRLLEKILTLSDELIQKLAL